MLKQFLSLISLRADIQFCLSVSVGCYLSCEFCATAQISKKLVKEFITRRDNFTNNFLSKDYINDWSTQKKLPIEY